MVDYRLDLAGPEHVAPLPDIERAADRLYEGTGLLDGREGDTTSLEELHEAQRQGQLLVALHGDAVVGFALVCEYEDHAHLEELSVHPDHARRGIGGRLVEAVCVLAAERKLSDVTLTTFRQIPWNAPFYRRLGFAEVCDAELSRALRRIVAEEAERGLDPTQRVVMRKPVGPDGGRAAARP